MPFVIRGLGVERFGILALAWAIMGAAAMLDLGLGRALTQVVARRRATDDTASSIRWSRPPRLSSGPWPSPLLRCLRRRRRGLRTTSSASIRCSPPKRATPLRCSRSACLLSSAAGALQGVLEGHLRFDLSNLVRIPLSALNYLAPLAILPWTTDLVWIVAGIVLARVLGFAAYAALVRRVMGAPDRPWGIRPQLLGPVLILGGWMAASTVVAALIIYLDRFAIGALLTMSALAFYVTPFEVVSRLSIIPGAVGGALLPAFASLTHAAAPTQADDYFERGLRYIALLVFPAALLIVLFAQEGLTLWVGDEFAAASTRIAQILAVGIFGNSLAMIPLIFLYGVGRPDIAAKIHLLELPVYAIVLWQLVLTFGAEGAALAWTLRAFIDAVLLFAVARRIYPTQEFRPMRIPIAMLIGVGVLAFGCLLGSAAGRLAYGALILGAFAVYGWLRLLTTHERLALARAIGRRPKSSL